MNILKLFSQYLSENFMFAHANLPPHLHITSRTPSRICESCWFVLFDEKVTEPSEEVGTKNSHWDEFPLWTCFFEQDSSEKNSPTHDHDRCSNKMKQFGHRQFMLCQIKRIKFLISLKQFFFLLGVSSRRHLL